MNVDLVVLGMPFRGILTHPGRSNSGVKLLFEKKLKEMAGTNPCLK